MKKLLVLTLLNALLFAFGAHQQEANAPSDTQTVRGTFVNGRYFFYDYEGTDILEEVVGILSIPRVGTETLAGIKRILTAEEFSALSPSQQAALTEADERMKKTEAAGGMVNTAYGYLMWLEQTLSPGSTTKILKDDPDLISFLLQGLTNAELASLPADVQKVLRQEE